MYNDDSENESDDAGGLRLPLNRRTLISGGMITGVAAFLARPGGANGATGCGGTPRQRQGRRPLDPKVGLNFTALERRPPTKWWYPMATPRRAHPLG